MGFGSRRIFILGLIMTNAAVAGQLEDFSSDGCSQFPDGTFSEQDLWCDCCIKHDLAYWQGGNRKQKQQADQVLRDCVFQKTGNTLLAEAMYVGVTLGGSPVFPTWYRWGYGWRYGRGFQSLNQYEQQQVIEKLQHYQLSEAISSCSIEHPLQRLLQNQFGSSSPPNSAIHPVKIHGK